MGKLADKEVRGNRNKGRKLRGLTKITAEECAESLQRHFKGIGGAGTGGIGSGSPFIASLEMGVGMRSDRDPAVQFHGHGGYPLIPGDGKTESLLRQVERGDPGTERRDHLSWKKNPKRHRATEKLASLKQRRKSTHMVDMTVRDEHHVDLPQEVTTLPEGMDARLSRIDEEVPAA
jgi:hypothetical protein